MIVTFSPSPKLLRPAFIVLLFVFSIALGAITTYSWTGPSGSPPGANVVAPLNLSNVSQIKSGALSVNGFSNQGSTYVAGNLGVGIASPAQKLHVNGSIRGTGFCINTSCVTAWPEAWSYGASTWTGWIANGSSLACPAGRVVVGVGIREDLRNEIQAVSHWRLLCRVLGP